jgi:hypothetical protein
MLMVSLDCTTRDHVAVSSSSRHAPATSSTAAIVWLLLEQLADLRGDGRMILGEKDTWPNDAENLEASAAAHNAEKCARDSVELQTRSGGSVGPYAMACRIGEDGVIVSRRHGRARHAHSVREAPRDRAAVRSQMSHPGAIIGWRGVVDLVYEPRWLVGVSLLTSSWSGRRESVPAR